MRVIVIVKATKDSEAGVMPPPELLGQMGAFNQALVDAGVFIDAGGFKPSAAGARVALSGEERAVTKGPFANDGDLASGFWLWSRTSTKRSPGRSAVPLRLSGPSNSRSGRSSRWRTSSDPKLLGRTRLLSLVRAARRYSIAPESRGPHEDPRREGA
jgi:hypothetical protein